LCVLFEIVHHGGHWGDTVQALARWRHPVASSEALDVLHWVMHLASCLCIAMAIEIARDSSAFFVAVNLLFATTIR
jgi:hypothetical protein